MSSESEARVEAILSEIRKSKEGYIDSDDFRGTVKLIRRLNTESAHFIWELLQNAEDARAERIFFTLEKDKLIVKHSLKKSHLYKTYALGSIELLRNENFVFVDAELYVKM